MINFRLIKHLWSFLALAEEQHFGRAAKKLGMSQPPLSEQIQTLEAVLKVSLFERSRKGATLTSAGKAILPEVRKLAEYLTRIEAALHESVLGQSGIVTIGAITSAMVDVLPDMIRDLKQASPDLTVFVKEIDTAEAIPMLENGEIDLAFARLDAALHAQPSIRVWPLNADRLAAALPAGHPLANQVDLALSQLADETFVMFPRSLNPGYFDTLIACCHQHGFTPRILHEARTVASQVAFVGCGQGIALVPQRLEKMCPHNVVFRPLTGAISVITTSLIWHERLQTSHPFVFDYMQALNATSLLIPSSQGTLTEQPEFQ